MWHVDIPYKILKKQNNFNVDCVLSEKHCWCFTVRKNWKRLIKYLNKYSVEASNVFYEKNCYSTTRTGMNPCTPTARDRNRLPLVMQVTVVGKVVNRCFIDRNPRRNQWLVSIYLRIGYISKKEEIQSATKTLTDEYTKAKFIWFFLFLFCENFVSAKMFWMFSEL